MGESFYYPVVGSSCGNGHFIPDVFAPSKGSFCSHFHRSILDMGCCLVLNVSLSDDGVIYK